MKKIIALSALAFLLAFIATLSWKLSPELTRPKYVDPAFRIPSPLEIESIPTASHFDFPLGNENGAMAYNAQHFTENKHLAADPVQIVAEMFVFGEMLRVVSHRAVLIAEREQRSRRSDLRDR